MINGHSGRSRPRPFCRICLARYKRLFRAVCIEDRLRSDQLSPIQPVNDIVAIVIRRFSRVTPTGRVAGLRRTFLRWPVTVKLSARRFENTTIVVTLISREAGTRGEGNADLKKKKEAGAR